VLRSEANRGKDVCWSQFVCGSRLLAEAELLKRSPEYLRGIENMNKNTPVCTTPYLSIGSGPRPNGGDVGDKAHKM